MSMDRTLLLRIPTLIEMSWNLKRLLVHVPSSVTYGDATMLQVAGSVAIAKILALVLSASAYPDTMRTDDINLQVHT